MGITKECVTLITGASHGIGRTIALRLASRFSALKLKDSAPRPRIAIHYNTSKNEALKTAEDCQELGAETFLCQADISKEDDCYRLIASTRNKWGKINYLVNNAATTEFTNSEDEKPMSLTQFNHIMETNLFGPYLLSYLAAKSMQQQNGGAIVNISSVAGITGKGSSTAYALSKGGLNTLTFNLATTFPKVRSNAICPRVVASDHWWSKKIESEEARKLFFEKSKALPLQKIADATLFLLDNSDPLLTGKLIGFEDLEKLYADSFVNINELANAVEEKPPTNKSKIPS